MKNILMRIVDVKKYYKSGREVVKALDGVSLDVMSGEVIGLLGVNGAGKTTLSSIIATLHPLTGGDIHFNGQSIYKDINAYRRIIGFCPQKPNLIKELTVEQNLRLAGAYFDMSRKDIESRMDELMTRFDLQKYKKFKPEALSGGFKQRVSLARSLMHSPKLLILDEPTVGLDPHIRRQLWDDVKNLKDGGVTVVLTTHYLDEAEVLSDRICVLEKGHVKLVDTPENLKSIYKKDRLEDVFLHLMNEDSIKPEFFSNERNLDV